MERGQKPREYYRDEYGVHPYFDIQLHYVGQAGEPAFQNGWANVGDPYMPCCFGRDMSGGVHLFGRVIGGLMDTVIYTLPVVPINHRPDKTIVLKTPVQGSGNIEINTNGEVKLIA